ncbi:MULTISPECIES: hypothetical protein [Mesonia]|nr:MULTISPECIES: hypothetical protein [Mesonia]
MKAQKAFISKAYRSINMKEEIYKAIDISDSIDDLVFNLKKNKIQTKIG